MACHYIQDKEVGRVLIPECWGTVHSNDMEDCYCSRTDYKTELEKRISVLERKIKKIESKSN